MIGNKGVAYVWITILVVLFMVAIAYVVFSQVYVGNVWPQAEEYFESLNLTDEQSQKVQDTMTTIKNVWIYWPLMLIFGLLLWGIVSAQRKEPVYEPY